MFALNKNLKPSVEKLTLGLKDCKIIFYEIYNNGIEDAFDDVVFELIKSVAENKISYNTHTEIHIPLFNHPDSYNICEYRVKLDVDENIMEFKRSDYFKFWGVKKEQKYSVYDLSKRKIIRRKFYTQDTYDKLFNWAYENGKL